MSTLTYGSEKKMERKIISVSGKRQITIPQKYYEQLGFDNEAECILQNGAIVIRPVRNRDNGAFSEEILTELIKKGYEGQELLSKFKEMSKKVRPAVEALIEEADAFAENGGDGVTMDDLLGPEV